MREPSVVLRGRRLAALVAASLGLAACGGGGGNVRPSSAPSSPPPSTPSTPQPPIDAQLALTSAYAAHGQGYTGLGVTIGVVDSGIMRSNPALAGRVRDELVYVDPATNNTAVDDVVGHGTWVSQIAAGAAFAQFPGGIAPGASLVSARIIGDKAPSDDGKTPPSQVSAADAAPFGAINDDLIAAGVKVMNNSWGGITWSSGDTATTKGFHDAYARFVNDWGGLVVFAAGNDSQGNPSTIAALPSLAPDLEKGWLAVVAVDSSHPTQLDSYSNKCGVAMDYCLAAPGDVIVLDKDATASTANPSYYIVEGTSFAAPQVSGAAALVWQAYPYFSNDLVRQTLLGTADDLGAPGPDPVFGYGELDVGKAVNGPMRFDWGDVTVSFSGTSSWNNPISGAGGLVKQGDGTLELTQPVSYTGLTQVQGGTLIARSLAANLSIGAGGTVQGTHSIGGSVANGGVLAVAGGDVSVGGDYAQQGGGRLAVSLGSALRVAGKATLGGGDVQVIGTEQGYVVSAHTDVLSAQGGLTGTFSGLSEAPGVLLTASLGYDANSAWLDVQQVQVTAVQGATYTAASYGAAQRVQGAFQQLDAQVAAGGATADGAMLLGAASLQRTATTAALQRSLESLSGQLHAASAAMTFEAIDAGTRALSARFDELLDGAAVAGWSRNLGYHGGLSRSGYAGVGYDLDGWMSGADRRVGANGVVGYAVNQSRGLGRLAESADQGRSRAIEGMLYGGLVQDDWYALGRFGVGHYREDMRRELQLGGLAAGVGSDADGRYGVAYGEGGYRLDLGALRLTPYADVEYAQIRRDGFGELGGYGFGLKSGAQSVARWQAGLGLRTDRRWTLAGGGRLDLQTHLSWQRAFAMRGDVFEASFTGLEQWAPLGGVGLSRYEGVAGASLAWTASPRSALQLGYDQYLGQRDRGRMATLDYRLSF